MKERLDVVFLLWPLSLQDEPAGARTCPEGIGVGVGGGGQSEVSCPP